MEDEDDRGPPSDCGTLPSQGDPPSDRPPSSDDGTLPSPEELAPAHGSPAKMKGKPQQRDRNTRQRVVRKRPATKKPAAAPRGPKQAHEGRLVVLRAQTKSQEETTKQRIASARKEKRDALASIVASEKKQLKEAKAQSLFDAQGSSPMAAPTIDTQRAAALKAEELGAQFVGMTFMLELFAGCMRLTGACAEKGLRIVVPLDNALGERPWADVTDPRVSAIIMACIDNGLIWYIHMATECKMWSAARSTGSAVQDTKVVLFTESVLERIAGFNRLARPWQHRIHVSLENPKGSLLYSLRRIRDAMEALQMFPIIFSCCAFGASYQKNTEVWTTIAGMKPLGRSCKDVAKHVHDKLEGKVVLGDGNTAWKTSLAAAYVPDLCRAWAECLSKAAPASAKGGHDLSPAWQEWFMKATGCKDTYLDTPTCPKYFVSPWRGLELVWKDDDGSAAKRKRKKDEKKRKKGTQAKTGPRGHTHDDIPCCF